jgi:hypothetical protein
MPKRHPLGTVYRVDLGDGTASYARLVRGETTLEFYDLRQPPCGPGTRPRRPGGAADPVHHHALRWHRRLAVVARIGAETALYRLPSFYVYNNFNWKCTVIIDGDHLNTLYRARTIRTGCELVLRWRAGSAA